MSYTLQLSQRLTVVQNRYEVVRTDDGTETLLAYAEQKRFSLREHVTFYGDEQDRRVAFTLAARNVVDLAGSYDICGPTGERLGTLRKDAVASFARSTYHLGTPRGELTARERGSVLPLVRRVVDVVGSLPWVLPIHFDVTDAQGSVVMTVERLVRVRDVYRVTVHDDALDWRLAAAAGVAFDAFMDR